MIKRTQIILILIQSLIFSKEFPVHEIKLLGPITDPKQEISGMDWFQDKLLFLLLKCIFILQFYTLYFFAK